ncbi:MAG: DUF6273 domain-containing protein [Oscillospiraceae bacterium]|nr:DUF6273 domain-containing protein [Oscillospiraceae bacterium]
MGFDPVSYIIGHRAGAAAADPLKSWSELQLWLRAGQLGQVLEAGDRLNVEVGGTVRDFDVLGLDEDEPVGAGLQHVLSLQAHDILNQMQFDPPQYLFAVTEAACQHYGWSSTGADAGMPAGTYHVTLLYGAYDGGTNQDGTYQFTTTQRIPIGGGIRHSAIGQYGGEYTKAQILSGSFTAYGADTVTELESGLPTAEGSGGTGLGTTTATDPTYLDGDSINFSIRQAHGANRWSTSYIRQYLNSFDAELTFVPATVWSRNMSTRPEGFLHTLDPELRAVIGKVRKRYALSVADGYGYEDVEDYCTLSTFLDVNQGTNNNIAEGPVTSSGVVTRTNPYTFWNGTVQEDRVKYLGSTASGWLIGSTHPTYSGHVRGFNASGRQVALRASNTGGIVPSLFIT